MQCIGVKLSMTKLNKNDKDLGVCLITSTDPRICGVRHCQVLGQWDPHLASVVPYPSASPSLS